METSDSSGIIMNDTEYCTLVGDQYFNNDTFKVKISKLTPFSLFNGRKTFNSKILINDKDVSPSISKQITLQNYLTIKRSALCNLVGVSNAKGNIPNGTILKCSCRNGNYATMEIVDSNV